MKSRDYNLIVHYYTVRGPDSSVVEHSTAGREVTGSISVSPFVLLFYQFFTNENTPKILHGLGIELTPAHRVAGENSTTESSHARVFIRVKDSCIFLRTKV